MLRFIVVVMLAACGADEPLPPPERLPTSGDTYVISGLQIPRYGQKALDLALDVDGDEIPDNAFGVNLAFISVTLDIDLTAEANQILAGGDALMLLALHRDRSGMVADTARMFLGADTDDDPSNNLDGSGELRVRDHAPLDDAVFGTIDPASISVGGGRLTIENMLFARVAVPLVRARIEAAFDGDRLRGVIAGGIPKSAMRRLVVATAALAISAEVAETCDPAASPCCPDGSRAASYVLVMDADHDCQVTIAEVVANDLIQTFADPDLDFDGDGQRDAVSFAFGFTAAPASFEIPPARTVSY